MSWLLWRQSRSQLLTTTAVVALFAVAVALTGVHMAHVYHDATSTCAANGTCDLQGHLFSGYGAIIDAVHLSIALPLLLGAFLGAPLIARETEHATNVLAWTQTVTRRRWLFTKVGSVLVATVVVSAIVSALVTWWSRTPNALDGNRFQGAQFDTQNVAPIAFALFGVALGLATGAFFRRTLPALAATVGLYAGIRVLVAVYVRPHYMKALTISSRLGSEVKVPSGSWSLGEHIVDPSGGAVPASGRINIPSSCQATLNTRDGPLPCLGRLGYRSVARFHPPSQYWHFQWTESAIFVVLAAGLVAFALVRTLRRDA